MEKSEQPERLNIEEAREEAEKMKHVLKRRRVIGSPLTSDYEEANEKVEKIKKNSEGIESKELRKIEDLFDLVIFDWDGVVYDSMDNIAETAVEIVKHFGRELTVEDFHESYDQPFWEYYRRLGLPASTEEEKAYIYKIYHDEILPKIKEKQTKKSDVYPEIEDTLRELVARQIRIAIVSAHKPQEIIDILTTKGLIQYVDYPVGLAHNKTEAIKSLCEIHGFDAERVLMLGDLPSDLRDARKAGVKVAGVARREGQKDRLSSYDPDFMFDTVGPEIFHLIPHEDK